jgi:thymidylate synthase
MAQIDLLTNALITNVLENGIWQEPEDVRAKWDDGSPAYARSVTDIQWKCDNSEALAITTKEFYEPLAVREGFWIWVFKSNIVQDLRNMNKSGKSIWDKWENKDPNSRWYKTIGPAYGWVLAQRSMLWKVSNLNLSHLNRHSFYQYMDIDGITITGDDIHVMDLDQTTPGLYIKIDQVDHIIQTMLRGAGSRRILTTLWIPAYLDRMMITPCVWATQWLRHGGKLNLTVSIRSNDICIGNPFNVFQYQVLQFMMAQIVGLPVGTITFNITDAHIYDRHIDLAREQILEPTHDAPKLWINPEIKNFYDFKVSDIKLIGKTPAKKYDYELSV